MALIDLKGHEHIVLMAQAHYTLVEEGSTSKAVSILEQALRMAAKHAMTDVSCVTSAIPIEELQTDLKEASKAAREAQENT